MRHFCLSVFFVIQFNSMPASADDVSDAIAQLKDASPLVRYQAARTLRKPGTHAESAVSALTAALNDRGAPIQSDFQYLGPRVKDAASVALVRIGKAAVPALIDALASEDPIVLEMAARTLADIGPGADKAFPALRHVLTKADPKGEFDWYRLDAVRAIARVGAQADVVVPILMRLFRTDTDDMVRQVVIESLHDADPNGDLAIPILIEAIGNDDADIMSAAIVTLEKYGADALPALKRLQASLSTTRHRGAVYNDFGYSVPVRRDAIRTLGSIGPGAREAVPRLMRMMEQDSDMQTRVEAAAALCRICPDEGAVTRPAFAFINSSKAYSAFGTIGSDAAVAQLRNVLRNEGASKWRQKHQAAVDALAEAGPNAAPAVPELIQLIATDRKGSDDATTFLLRRSAIIALGRIGEASAQSLPELKRIANDPGDDISDWNIGDLAEEAVRSIQKSMKEEPRQQQD